METKSLKRLIIIGAGGHGKVAADIALKTGYTDIAFLDDDSSIKECGGFPVIGGSAMINEYSEDKFIAIGNPSIRRRLQKDIDTVTLIHPAAVIGRRVEIGRGTVIMAGAVVNPDTVIGEGCIINTAASVDHDCRVGDFSHIAVGAHLCGTVVLGSDSWVGAGAVLVNNINICDSVMIAAGAVVIRDINEKGTYIGVPAALKRS